MAALAALLINVAFHMADIPSFMRILRVAYRSDVFVLLVCFSLTVIFDMVIGVGVGVVLASILFMHRMAKITTGQVLAEETPLRSSLNIPKEIVLYEIAGPFFFGAAERAMEALEVTNREARVVIFIMDHVPAMDVTALVALESAITKLNKDGKIAMLVGVQDQPARVISKSSLAGAANKLRIFRSLDYALKEATAATSSRQPS